MEQLQYLLKKFSTTTEDQEKAIFNSLFIISNRLQTIFDQHIPDVSLKQFMLMTIVNRSKEQMTFTQLGTLLGCSRQNIKKLAHVLEQKGYVKILQKEQDVRASYLCPTEKMKEYFDVEFKEHQNELRYLFEVYTPQEIETLFQLISRLYEGVDNLKNKTSQNA